MPSIAAHGLHPPTIDEAFAAVERVHGASAAGIWRRITERAGQPLRIEHLIELMRTDGHPVVRLCGEALRIRQRSHAHLAGPDRSSSTP